MSFISGLFGGGDKTSNATTTNYTDSSTTLGNNATQANTTITAGGGASSGSGGTVNITDGGAVQAQGKRILICPTNVLCMFTPGLFFYT